MKLENINYKEKFAKWWGSGNRVWRGKCLVPTLSVPKLRNVIMSDFY